ncbi:AAA family ATPase [Candidatus Chloroploca sp. Khr17]|uniref:AAA family ATPase n=1 Tax=Candidatus Chloroploca sp. Khr17 TaxID=2496869 RepID=UPI00101D1C51|nr:AAA family ATPase [Candidatus Chloroploca sp. Khr17]
MVPIILIVGAPAVGKTAVAQALAERFGKSIHVAVDSLRDMVVSGYVAPDAAWGPVLVEQLTLARKIARHMALAYYEAGYTVLVDDFWDPHSLLSEYNGLETYPDVYRVILFPRQDVAKARNRQRSGVSPVTGYIDWGIEMVYRSLNQNIGSLRTQGWIYIDNSDMSIDATADCILKAVHCLE